jgi:hypothetical protein
MGLHGYWVSSALSNGDPTFTLHKSTFGADKISHLVKGKTQKKKQAD